MMYETIKNFYRQFSFRPVIVNAGKLHKFSRVIVVGMGGSNLSADLLRAAGTGADILIHRDYGLPPLPALELKKSLVILSSYSGGTEEVIDAFEKAKAKKLARAVIAAGGRLLELAKKDGVPYVQIPATGIQPRSALGFNLLALLKIIGEENVLKELNRLEKTFDSEEYRTAGQALAKKLRGFVTVVYTSTKNRGLGYNWKVRLHETGKIPAFSNAVPEINHNEMTGFDVLKSTQPLSENFYFIFLKDSDDHQKIKKRMVITEKLYRDRGLRAETIELRGKTIWHKIFGSILLADWTAYYLAEYYGTDPEQVPMVEEFKLRIKKI